jgi:hypothetical protein
VLRDEIEETGHRLEPRRLAGDAAVQAHRHHARTTRALGIEGAERRREVIVKISAGAELA